MLRRERWEGLRSKIRLNTNNNNKRKCKIDLKHKDKRMIGQAGREAGQTKWQMCTLVVPSARRVRQRLLGREALNSEVEGELGTFGDEGRRPCQSLEAETAMQGWLWGTSGEPFLIVLWAA